MTEQPITEVTDELLDEHYTADGDRSTITDAWEGVVVYSSWGYGQTNVEFAQIVEVTSTGKSAYLKMCRGSVADRGRGSETVVPTAETYGDRFLLPVRQGTDGPRFSGTYPYSDGDMDGPTRSGSLYIYNRDQGLHQTPPNMGH